MSEDTGAKQAHADANRFLEFNLGQEKFAIPLLSVKEVIAVPETTKVPFTPEYFLGIMNLRGQVLSVIDLRSRMQIEPLQEGAETAVIIADLEYTHLGLVVDSINRVIAVDEEQSAPPPELEANHTTEFVTGCYRGDENLILFIDVDKILDSQDRKHIEQQSNSAEAV